MIRAALIAASVLLAAPTPAQPVAEAVAPTKEDPTYAQTVVNVARLVERRYVDGGDGIGHRLLV